MGCEVEKSCAGGTKFESKMHVHVNQFIGVMDALKPRSNGSVEFANFLSWIRTNVKDVVQTVRFFMVMECRDKQYWKVLTHIAPGSNCHKFWSYLCQHEFTPESHFEGQAPRNGYARKLIRDLKLLGGFTDKRGVKEGDDDA